MKNKVLTLIFLFSLSTILIVQGCKDENPLMNSGTGSIYDPSIRPAVIFTYPANSSVGPFSGIFYGDMDNNYPHFRIQFNKVMKSEMLDDEYIKITGFDEPVTVYGYNQYNSSLSGMYEFRVRKSNYGDYYDSYAIYRLGKTYSVTVSGLMEDLHNQVLGKDVTFSFTIGTTFKVISSYPKDSLSSGSNEVRITFNSQVDSTILSKVTISPAIPGSWYITNSGTALYFYPNSAYTTNSIYTVSLPADTKDKFGNLINAPYSFSFKTGDFRILSSYPSDGQSNVSLSNSLSFYTSASVLNSSIASAFSISPSIPGSTYSYGNSSFGFSPELPLKEKTTYTVTISTSLSATNGNKLQNPYTMTFTTEGFRLYSVYPSSSRASRYSNVEVQFNAPLDTSTAKTGFSISPTIAGKMYFSNKNKTIVFKPDSVMASNTNYYVSLSNSLKSALGNSLEYSTSFQFTTGD